MVTDQQVRRLKMLVNREKTKEQAAAKAGMDKKTARKYPSDSARRIGDILFPAKAAIEYYAMRGDEYSKNMIQYIKNCRAEDIIPLKMYAKTIFKRKPDEQLLKIYNGIIHGYPDFKYIEYIHFKRCLPA